MVTGKTIEVKGNVAKVTITTGDSEFTAWLTEDMLRHAMDDFGAAINELMRRRMKKEVKCEKCGHINRLDNMEATRCAQCKEVILG